MRKIKKIAIGIASIVLGTIISSKSYAVRFYDTLDTKYEGAVERLAELEIVSGVSEKVFEPNRTVTRAEFAKMMVTASLKPAEIAALLSDDAEIVFEDVDKEAWYYNYVVVAVNAQYMKGYEDGTFRPDNEITYAEISKMVTLALGHSYLRSEGENGWSTEYVNKMYEIGCFRNANFLSIDDKATRGNVALIIWNMLNTTTWKLVYKNETTGFAFVDSNETLFDQKIINHESRINAKVQGFFEKNGMLYVQLGNEAFKLFDQDEAYDFSMIGGTSDVLLKRVEYPEREVRLEAVGISTDVGAKLYEGTYKVLTEEGFDLSNKFKLGKDTDYAYLYHYENSDDKDRAIGVKWDNFTIVEDIKISDERDKEKASDTSESDSSSLDDLKNQFYDDVIAYRYTKNDDEFERTITINKGEIIIKDGAVLFKNNQRVSWKDLEADDLLVELLKDRYYCIANTTSKIGILKSYNIQKGEYAIEIEGKTYEMYANTKFSSYYTKDIEKLKGQKVSELDRLIGKKVKLILNDAEKVLKVEVISDDIDSSKLNFGIYSHVALANSKKVVQSSNRLYLIQDGKEVSLKTKLDSVKADKGTLIKYSFDKDQKDVVQSVQLITGKTDLTDKIRVEKFDTEKLQEIVSYYDNAVPVTRITNLYDWGKFEDVKDIEIDTISMLEFMGVKDYENTYCYALMDLEDEVIEIYLYDDTAKSNIFFGKVTRIYKDNEDSKIHVKVSVVGLREEQDYVYSQILQFEEGDFIKFLVDKENMTFIERYNKQLFGHKYDLKVTGTVMDEKGKTVVGYEVEDTGVINLSDWTLDLEDENYNLNAYDIFFMEIGKTDTGYEIAKILPLTAKNADLKKGDLIAINEINDCIIVYRGFKK